MNDRGFSQLLVLVVIIIAFITIAFNVPTIRAKIRVRMTWQRSFIFAGVYLGVLILLVPILSILPDKGYIELIDNSDHDLAFSLSQDIIRDSDLYNHLLTKGNLDGQQGLYKISSQTFKVDTNKLSFLLYDPFINNGHYRIFIEQTDADDGEIEVSTYATTQLAGGIDFTKLILPPGISFQKGMLSFRSPGRQMLEFKQLKNDFTLNQFRLQNSDDFSGSVFGGQIINIHVPKSMEIDKGIYGDQIQILSND